MDKKQKIESLTFGTVFFLLGIIVNGETIFSIIAGLISLIIFGYKLIEIMFIHYKEKTTSNTYCAKEQSSWKN